MFIVAYLFVDLRISGYTLLMYKQMLAQEQVVKIRLKKAKSKEDLRDLARFHRARITEFQHERLVHLLVAFFFALLCLCALGLFFWFSSLTIDGLLTVLSGIMVLALVTLELFYIRYYYQLENGVQKLYELTIIIEEEFITK